MSKWTPGPWRFEPGTKIGLPYVVYGEDVIHVESGKDSDARLIAAAPDLLDVLARCASALEHYDQLPSHVAKGLRKAAREAIAKAEGTS